LGSVNRKEEKRTESAVKTKTSNAHRKEKKRRKGDGSDGKKREASNMASTPEKDKEPTTLNKQDEKGIKQGFW